MSEAVRTKARPTDPETSHEAAAAAIGEAWAAKQEAIWQILRRCGPTDHIGLIGFYREYRRSLDLPMQSDSSIRTRCAELVDQGRVRWTGGRITRPGHRPGREWEAIAPAELAA